MRESAKTVLVTSGGTRVPIDDVRWIGNQSTGSFGARIVEEFLKGGWEVVHLVARDAVLPFQKKISLHTAREEVLDLSPSEHEAFSARYRAITFDTFDRYAHELRGLLAECPTVCCLAAAVADYGMSATFGPSPTKGKIRSDRDSITLELVKLPKLIDEVKTLSPATFLVGFKLLSRVSERELVRSATDLLARSKADLVVANDQQTVQHGHVIHLIDEHGLVQTVGPAGNLAATLVGEIVQRT